MLSVIAVMCHLLFFDFLKVLDEVLAVLQDPVSEWVRYFLVNDRQLSDVRKYHQIQLRKTKKENWNHDLSHIGVKREIMKAKNKKNHTIEGWSPKK